MWRLPAAVVLMALWQACHAKDLVNLADPVQTWEIFSGGEGSKYVRFTGDESTVTIPGSRYTSATYYATSEAISPTRYRITVSTDTARKHYPSSWKVTGVTANYKDVNQDEVTGAVFKNGAYEAALPIVDLFDTFTFYFRDGYEATITGIELLGPRKLLDALWPYGKYPCSRRLDWLGAPNGPEKIFSRPKPSKGNLRRLFDPSGPPGFLTVKFDGFKPAIFGTELQKPAMLHEVVADVFSDSWRKLVLQGSFCQPHCRKFGSKGWVRLAQLSRKKGYNQRFYHRLSIKNPDKYKGYRVKIYRRKKGGRVSFLPYGFYFLQCP